MKNLNGICREHICNTLCVITHKINSLFVPYYLKSYCSKLWILIYQIFKEQLNLGFQVFCMWFYVARLEFIDVSKEKPDAIFKDWMAKGKTQGQRHSLISQETWTHRKVSVDDANFAILFVLLKTVTTFRKQISTILTCKVHVLGKLIVM